MIGVPYPSLKIRMEVMEIRFRCEVASDRFRHSTLVSCRYAVTLGGDERRRFPNVDQR